MTEVQKDLTELKNTRKRQRSSKTPRQHDSPPPSSKKKTKKNPETPEERRLRHNKHKQRSYVKDLYLDGFLKCSQKHGNQIIKLAEIIHDQIYAPTFVYTQQVQVASLSTLLGFCRHSLPKWKPRVLMHRLYQVEKMVRKQPFLKKERAEMKALFKECWCQPPKSPVSPNNYDPSIIWHKTAKRWLKECPKLSGKTI